MPTVEKISGGRVHVRGIGRFERGDRADVDEESAAYLVEERGDFRLVDGDEEAGEHEGGDDEDVDDTTDDVCGAEMSDGSTCDRPADECPYHGEE